MFGLHRTWNALEAGIAGERCIPHNSTQLTREEVHQRGLAGAVGPHDGDAAAHVDADVEACQAKVLAAGVLEVDVHELDEGGAGDLRGVREGKVHRVVRPLARSVRGLGGRVVVGGRALGLALLRLLGRLVDLQANATRAQSGTARAEAQARGGEGRHSSVQAAV